MDIQIPTQKRDDLSRFLIHLTRDHEDHSASENLLGILNDKMIEARNAHCLVMHKLEERTFSPLLRQQFKSVCFTEAPLSQVSQLTRRIPKRSIKLRPYGVVFLKDRLMACGANPAIYLNAEGNSLSKFLVAQFDATFKNIRSLKGLKAAKQKYFKSIIQFYALLNVVRQEGNFMWEREWRHMGHFCFEYINLVAIIAENSESFRKKCTERLSPTAYSSIRRIPIVDPSWRLEEVVEEIGVQMWNQN
jgi:hypothetical protein